MPSPELITGAEAGADPDRTRLRRVLVGLCATEIVSWGILYYAFAVLGPTISADTGWPPTLTTGAFSAALVAAALVGIPVGRILDHHGPRLIMTGGSVLAVLAVLLVAWSPNPVIFVAGWLLAGVAMAGVLYQPAFAALTRWYGTRRLGALTAVTLIAGLASTVFAPLTSGLAAVVSWRETYLVLAVVLAVITIPVHLIVLRHPWPPEDHREADPATDANGHAVAVLRSRPFGFLLVGLTLSSLAMYAAVINLVPLLHDRGLGGGIAAWALGLGGVGQVAGRLLYGPLARRVAVRVRTVIIFSLAAITTAALAVLPGPTGLLIAVVMLAGVSRGIATLLQATAVTVRWGARAYGRLSGTLAAPVTAVSALAPWIGAALAVAVGGYAAMFALLAGVAAAGVILLALSVPRRVTKDVTCPASPAVVQRTRV